MLESLKEKNKKYYDYSRDNMNKVLRKTRELHVTSWRELMKRVIISDRHRLDKEDIEGRNRALVRSGVVFLGTVAFNVFFTHRVLKRSGGRLVELAKNPRFVAKFYLLNLPFIMTLLIQWFNWAMLVSLKYKGRYPELIMEVKMPES